MRRFAGLALVLVGAFLLGSAAMSRFYLPGRLVVTPIDQYAQTVAPGPGTYLDVETQTEKSGDLVAQRTLKGDVAASSADTAVWDVLAVLETGDGTFVRATQDRVAVDRKTARGGELLRRGRRRQPTRHEGVSYKFPFDTEQREYQFWDVNSRQAYPARYVSEEQVQGLTVYKFVQQIPGQELRKQEVPASLVGEPGTSFEAPVWYENVRTVWVEPQTGVIVKGNEQNKTTLRDCAGPGPGHGGPVRRDLRRADAAPAGRPGEGRHLGDPAVTVWLPLTRPAARADLHRPRRHPAARRAGSPPGRPPDDPPVPVASGARRRTVRAGRPAPAG